MINAIFWTTWMTIKVFTNWTTLENFSVENLLSWMQCRMTYVLDYVFAVSIDSVIDSNFQQTCNSCS